MFKLHSEFLKTKNKTKYRKLTSCLFLNGKKVNTRQIAVESGFLSRGPLLFLSRCTKSYRNTGLNKKCDKISIKREFVNISY